MQTLVSRRHILTAHTLDKLQQSEDDDSTHTSRPEKPTPNTCWSIHSTISRNRLRLTFSKKRQGQKHRLIMFIQNSPTVQYLQIS